MSALRLPGLRRHHINFNKLCPVSPLTIPGLPTLIIPDGLGSDARVFVIPDTLPVLTHPVQPGVSALWETRETQPTCSLEAFSIIPEAFHGDK